MRQGSRRLVHLVNLSGHSQTAYFAPVPMSGIEVRIEGKYTSARTQRTAWWLFGPPALLAALPRP